MFFLKTFQIEQIIKCQPTFRKHWFFNSNARNSYGETVLAMITYELVFDDNTLISAWNRLKISMCFNGDLRVISKLFMNNKQFDFFWEESSLKMPFFHMFICSKSFLVRKTFYFFHVFSIVFPCFQIGPNFLDVKIFEKKRRKWI